MRLVSLVFLAVLLALGCAGSETRPVPSDAGTVDVQAVAGTRDAGTAGTRPPRDAGTRSWQSRRQPRASGHAATPKPIDPAVQACLTQPWANWDALERCLRGHGPATGPDGGHLLGGGTTRPPPHCSVQNVPAWFIDPVSGNDNNTGISNVSALKTYGELTARWGCGAGPTTTPTLTGPVVIKFLSSQPNASDRVVFDPILNEGASAYLLGQWTLVATGTLSSVVAKSTSAADGRLRADLGAGASGHLGGGGLFLVNASRSSSVAAINQVISGTTVALTQPFVSNAPTPPTRPAIFPAQDDTWANGDGWQLLQLPAVYLTEFNAKTPADDVSEDITFAFAEHIWVPDPTGPFLSNIFLGSMTTFSESWIDPLTFYTQASGGGGVQAINTAFNGGVILERSTILGGSMNGGLIDNLSRIDGDTILNLDVQTTGNGSSIGRVCVANADFDIFTQLSLTDQGVGAGYGSPHIYGTYTVDVSGASAASGSPGAVLAYDGAIGAAGNFLGVPTFQCDHNNAASARDFSHDIMAERGGIILSPGNLDTSIASGGFGGVAYCYANSIIAPTNLPTVSAGGSPLFAAGSCIGISQPVGGQVTITNTCPSSGGTLTNTAVSGPGFWFSNASSVLETTGVTFGGDVSQGVHSTGFQPLTVAGLKGNALPALSTGFLKWNGSAWVFTGSDVTSVTGTGATSCSPTSGAVVCSTPSVTVSGGAGISVTGGPAYTASIAAATAHSVMTTGAGSGGFSTVAPGTANTTFLMSNGSSAEPTYETPTKSQFTSHIGGSTVSMTASVSTLDSLTVTVASGQVVNAWATLSIFDNAGDSCTGDVTVDSAAFSASGQSIAALNTGGAISHPLNRQFTGLSAGTHTIRLLAANGTHNGTASVEWTLMTMVVPN